MVCTLALTKSHGGVLLASCHALLHPTLHRAQLLRPRLKPARVRVQLGGDNDYDDSAVPQQEPTPTPPASALTRFMHHPLPQIVLCAAGYLVHRRLAGSLPRERAAPGLDQALGAGGVAVVVHRAERPDRADRGEEAAD